MPNRFCSQILLLAFELLALGACAEVLIFSGERTLLAAIVVGLYALMVAARSIFVSDQGAKSDKRLLCFLSAVATGVALACSGWSILTLGCLVAMFGTQGRVWEKAPRPHLFILFCFFALGAVLSERDLARHLLLAGESIADLFFVPIGIILLLLPLWVFPSSADEKAQGSSRGRELFASIVYGGVLVGSWYALVQLPVLATAQFSSGTIVLISIFIASFGSLKAIPAGLFSDNLRFGITMLCLVGSVGLMVHARYPSPVSPCGSPPEPYRIPAAVYVYLLAAEDPIFLEHSGVDYYRLRRALRELLLTGAYGRGGSTLSMQLAKVCFLSEEKTLSRKFDQIFRALYLELSYEKAELLYWYLESVPFAPGVRGLRSASKYFYGVPPDKLNKEQALNLVQTIFDPSEFNPNTKVVPRNIRLRSAVIGGLGKRYCDRFLGDLSRIPEIEVEPKQCT